MFQMRKLGSEIKRPARIGLNPGSALNLCTAEPASCHDVKPTSQVTNGHGGSPLCTHATKSRTTEETTFALQAVHV